VLLRQHRHGHGGLADQTARPIHAAAGPPQQLKLRFYRLMVEYANHEELYLDAANYYRRIYDSSSVQANEDQWMRVLRGMVIYAVLAPHSNDQFDAIHRIAKEKNLEKLPSMKYVSIAQARWTASADGGVRHDLAL